MNFSRNLFIRNLNGREEFKILFLNKIIHLNDIIK